MGESPVLFMDFLKSGRDTSKFPNIERVEDLDDIDADATETWVLGDGYLRVFRGFEIEGMQSRGGLHLRIKSGEMVDAHFNSDTHEMIGQSGIYKMNRSCILGKDVEQGNVYKVDLRKQDATPS